MNTNKFFLEEETQVLTEVNQYLGEIKIELNEKKSFEYTIRKPEKIVISILTKTLQELYPKSEIIHSTVRDSTRFRINSFDDHMINSLDESIITINLKDNDLKQFEIAKRKREIEELDPTSQVNIRPRIDNEKSFEEKQQEAKKKASKKRPATAPNIVVSG